jgi:hypothetical protein
LPLKQGVFELGHESEQFCRIQGPYSNETGIFCQYLVIRCVSCYGNSSDINENGHSLIVNIPETVFIFGRKPPNKCALLSLSSLRNCFENSDVLVIKLRRHIRRFM